MSLSRMAFPANLRTFSLITSGCCLLAGCGGSSNAPNKTTVITAPTLPPGPVAATPVAAPPAAPVAVAPQKTEVASPGKKNAFGKESAQNRFLIPAHESSLSIFSVETSSTPQAFQVGDIPDRQDATQFTIQTAANSSTPGLAPGQTNRPKGFKLPEGFVEVPSAGYSPDGWPLRIRCDKTENLLGLVPGGTAIVGSDEGPVESQPAFTPFLESFYMDLTEVTLREYNLFRNQEKDKKSTKPLPALNDGENQDELLPALGLPFPMALAFARWAKKDLPTEAEFEKAARGPEGYRAPWGNSRAVWGTPRTPETITVVGSFAADRSLYGIMDLAGNAREWCSDWYSETSHAEAAKLAERSPKNWAGPKKASKPGLHVVKGNGPDWSAWFREGRPATEKSPMIGFRCVLRIKPSPEK